MGIRTYYKEYEQIKDRAVKMGLGEYINMKEEDREELDRTKTVICQAGEGHACVRYKVMANGGGLTDDECAIFADDGNLCFGYDIDGNMIEVYTD